MIRISAEFESPELAELALKRVRDSVPGIFSTHIMYNRRSDKAMRLRGGTLYTLIPTAVTTHNYLTAVIEFPTSEDIIDEPSRSRKTHAYVICEKENSGNVRSVLGAMGGMDIHTPIDA